MGLIISSGDAVVWESSQTAGRLFVEQAHSLERLVGAECGVGPLLSDEIEISPEHFGPFVERLADALASTNNGPLFTLSVGWLEVALAIYQRLFGHWPVVPVDLRHLIASAHHVMRAREPLNQADMPATALAGRVTDEDRAPNTLHNGPSRLYDFDEH